MAFDRRVYPLNPYQEVDSGADQAGGVDAPGHASVDPDTPLNMDGPVMPQHCNSYNDSRTLSVVRVQFYRLDQAHRLQFPIVVVIIATAIQAP